uniref:Uncharacterized protein n=1 Tax=Solanum tuberosum TaxID=4113 RepID=M1A7Q0_SOLTU
MFRTIVLEEEKILERAALGTKHPELVWSREGSHQGCDVDNLPGCFHDLNP